MREYKGDLYAYVTEGTKTLELMDKYEGIVKDSKGPYKRLILENSYYANVGKYICTYNLIIERIVSPLYAVGDITFTEFKTKKGVPVCLYCDSQLRKAYIEQKDILNKKEIYFEKPYYLRAQNSSNREGYGWEWDWSGGAGDYWEGTFYGETDNYGFVGVVIKSIKERPKPFQAKKEIKVELKTVQGSKYYLVREIGGMQMKIPYQNGMSKNDAILKFHKISSQKENEIRKRRK